MRAVIDPNVFISAALSRGGTCAKLIRAWLAGAFEVIVSPALIDELARVLSYPKIAKHISDDEAGELLALLSDHATTLDDPNHAPTVGSSDPADDYLICLAEEAAAVLVSGDTDLTSLAEQIPVYAPAAFARLLDLPM